jgi:pilus assembly protein CpaE
VAARKILVIDADSASLKYISNELRRDGYDVLTASSANEGLAAAWIERPDAILADPALPDLSGEELASRLRADARSASVPLVGIAGDARPTRRNSCIEAGYSEYLVKSPSLVAALRETLARLVIAEHEVQPEAGVLIAFLSAKGGTGTSSLCANLAMNMADQNPAARFVVADLVLPIGSIGGIVGYAGEQNIATMAQMPPSATAPEFLRTSLARLDDWGFHILAGSPDPQSGSEIDVERIEDLVHVLRRAYDFVILDLGRSLSRMSLHLIREADLVAMIVGEDLSSANPTRTVWEFLRSKGVQRLAMYPIMSRSVGLVGLTKEETEKIIGLPIRSAMPYLAENLSLANNLNRPYCIKFPADTASIILAETARQMVELARRRRTG